MRKELENDITDCIKKNVPWSDLDDTVKKALGSNGAKEYNKLIVQHSVSRQLQHVAPNLICSVLSQEMHYYVDLIDKSRSNCMLFPYHLSDAVIKRLRLATPYSYYCDMLVDSLSAERSYDMLPNFTAADCLRLLGIGRNQYIEMMNDIRLRGNRFGMFKKTFRDLLPRTTVKRMTIQPWWTVDVIEVDDQTISRLDEAEQASYRRIQADAPLPVCYLDLVVLRKMFRRRLVFFDVPVVNNDCIQIPPLDGFVMNRTTGDYFETLLYKVFVSIDEHSTVEELADILALDVEEVRLAVSLFCRLGFGHKLRDGLERVDPNQLHPSWSTMLAAGCDASSLTAVISADAMSVDSFDTVDDDQLLRELEDVLKLSTESSFEEAAERNVSPTLSAATTTVEVSSGGKSRIAFVFDSSLTAFLMMGNLSPGLKSHSVTLFEVGKLTDKYIDSLICELEKVSPADSEVGEARRYFAHALALRATLKDFRSGVLFDVSAADVQIDLIRCESLQHLDVNTVARLIAKNYSLLISMANIQIGAGPDLSHSVPHLGPASPIASTPWFSLFTYAACDSGPPSLLLVKGYRLRKLPLAFNGYSHVKITPWMPDAVSLVVSTHSAIAITCDYLLHSPVFVQAVHLDPTMMATPSLCEGDLNLKYLPFPLDLDDGHLKEYQVICPGLDVDLVLKVNDVFDLESTCGYITFVESGTADRSWLLTDVTFGLPLFSTSINRLVVDRLAVTGLLASAEKLERCQSQTSRLKKRLADFMDVLEPGLGMTGSVWPTQNHMWNGTNGLTVNWYEGIDRS